MTNFYWYRQYFYASGIIQKSFMHLKWVKFLTRCLFPKSEQKVPYQNISRQKSIMQNIISKLYYNSRSLFLIMMNFIYLVVPLCFLNIFLLCARKVGWKYTNLRPCMHKIYKSVFSWMSYSLDKPLCQHHFWSHCRNTALLYIDQIHMDPLLIQISLSQNCLQAFSLCLSM